MPHRRAAAFCSDHAVEQMFLGGKRAIVAGAHNPQGNSATQIEGGYKVSGHYQFGIGARHADWMAAGMTIAKQDGAFEVRSFFVPREKVRLLSNWDVLGMRGTGSVDYEIPEQIIDPAFAPRILGNGPLRGGATFALGSTGVATAGHNAVVLGLIKRAFLEIATIASTKKRPGYSGTIDKDPVFFNAFAIQEATYQAARCFVFGVYRDALDTAKRGEVLSDSQRARFSQATSWLHGLAAELVGFCHMWSGSAGIRNPSRMGRCLRDIYTATQHVIADRAKLTEAAAPILRDWHRDNGNPSAQAR